MLSLREPRPSVGPHVPQPTTRTGLAFPARAPIPPHVTTPRERAPRVDGTAGEKHILGHFVKRIRERALALSRRPASGWIRRRPPSARNRTHRARFKQVN